MPILRIVESQESIIECLGEVTIRQTALSDVCLGVTKKLYFM